MEDVAGAEREDEVAGSHPRCQAGDHVAEPGQERDGTAGTLGEVRVDDQLAADARLRLFARREDLGDDGLVGQRQGAPELALQVAGAGEQVRLEDGDDPPRARRSSPR